MYLNWNNVVLSAEVRWLRNKCKENNQNKRAVAVELLQVNLFAGDVWFVGAERGRWDGSERHEYSVDYRDQLCGALTVFIAVGVV